MYFLVTLLNVNVNDEINKTPFQVYVIDFEVGDVDVPTDELYHLIKERCIDLENVLLHNLLNNL